MDTSINILTNFIPIKIQILPPIITDLRYKQYELEGDHLREDPSLVLSQNLLHELHTTSHNALEHIRKEAPYVVESLETNMMGDREYKVLKQKAEELAKHQAITIQVSLTKKKRFVFFGDYTLMDVVHVELNTKN